MKPLLLTDAARASAATTLLLIAFVGEWLLGTAAFAMNFAPPEVARAFSAPRALGNVVLELTVAVALLQLARSFDQWPLPWVAAGAVVLSSCIEFAEVMLLEEGTWHWLDNAALVVRPLGVVLLTVLCIRLTLDVHVWPALILSVVAINAVGISVLIFVQVSVPLGESLLLMMRMTKNLAGAFNATAWIVAVAAVRSAVRRLGVARERPVASSA